MTVSPPLLVALTAIAVTFGLAGCTAAPPSAGADDDLQDPDSSTSGRRSRDSPASTDSGAPSPADDGDGNSSKSRGSPDLANLTFGPARTWVAPSQATIRPGVQTVTEGAGQCTSDFIFTSLDNMTVYIGQAAHCASLGGASDTNGCLTESLPLGTSVEVEGASQPGRLAYSSWIAMQEDGGAGADACARNDFALVELAPADAAKANPAMLHYGGPTALADAESMAWGDKVLTYGNSGLRFGLSPLSPHEGYVVESGGSGGWTTTIYTAPNGVPGDSGSGVLTADGQALGILVTLNSYPPAANGVTSLDHALDYAANHGMPVQLATWEQLDEGILP